MTKDSDSFRNVVSGIKGVTKVVDVKTKEGTVAVKAIFSDGSIIIYCLGKEYGWGKGTEDYVIALDIVNNVSKVVPYQFFKKYNNGIDYVLVERANFCKSSFSKRYTQEGDCIRNTLSTIMSSFNSNLRSVCSTAEVLNVALFVHDISKKADVISIEVIEDGIYSVEVHGILSECCAVC